MRAVWAEHPLRGVRLSLPVFPRVVLRFLARNQSFKAKAGYCSVYEDAETRWLKVSEGSASRCGRSSPWCLAEVDPGKTGADRALATYFGTGAEAAKALESLCNWASAQMTWPTGGMTSCESVCF